MGEVFLAEDTELDRKVALKFLSPYYTSDEELKSRFRREAKAAAALNHPNIKIVIFHVASKLDPVNFEQIHFFNLDAEGNQINPNPIYNRAPDSSQPCLCQCGLGLRWNFNYLDFSS